MASQTSNGAGGAVNLEIANNLTTGALSLGSDGQSSDITINTGTGDLICNTGSILVGDDEASPQIQVGGTGSTSRAIIDANSSRARVHGSLGPLLISSQSSVNVTPNGGSSLALHDSQSSGDLLIGTSASRTGNIDIGNAASNGNINIDSGSGNTVIQGNNVTIGDASATAQITCNSGANQIDMVANEIRVNENIDEAMAIRLYYSNANPNRNLSIISNNTSTIHQQFGSLDIEANSNISLLPGFTGALNIGTSASYGGDITIGNVTKSAGTHRITGGGATLQIDAPTGQVVLRDIESGSWTPVLGDGTNSFDMTLQQGQWTRIGRLVFVNMVMLWNGLGTPPVTGLLRVSGLPFTCAHTTGFSLNCTSGPSYVTHWQTSGKVVSGQNYVRLFVANAIASWLFEANQSDVNLDFNSSGELNGQFTYLV